LLPAEIKQLVARLDPGSFTSFVAALVAAEAARLGMPPGSVVMSDALTENDEGLDGLLRDVPEAASLDPSSPLPPGLVGLQLKTISRKQPSALGIADELRRPGPRRVLGSGGTYILVWSQDLNPAQRQATEAALHEEAVKVLQEDGIGNAPKTAVWDAQAVAGICSIHPAPVAEIGLADFGAALSLPELLESSTLQAQARPFQPDEAREAAVARLRERARASSDPLLMMLHGDPGAGKTRVIAHALDTDDLRDLVLYVNGTEDLGLLLTRLIRNRSSRGILFADELDEHDAAGVVQRLGGLGGRWRVISVTSRTGSRWIAEGGRNIVLPPLSPEATRQLIQQHSGLAETEAQRVAQVAAGFPELAFRLADELRAEPSLDLVRLARLPHPQEVLQRALRDADARQHLAPIALFNGVGFDGDFHYQLEAVAGTFDLDVAALERHCDAELGRFVSRAGRFRLISPLLVAIWLATDLIERSPRIEERILGLPEPLQEAFVQQLDYFGPTAPYLPAALARLIEDERFRRPPDFTEAAGRLLRASAAIIPTQVAQAIRQLLQASSDEELNRLPRRDLVWALEVLLWWPETWESAISSMYQLAQHENETWANNASNQFAQAFSIYLSGSIVPYRERAAWLERAIDRAGPEQLPLLRDAAASGLKGHHSRMAIGFEGGGEPKDWRPQSQEEYVEARRTAWKLLLRVRDRADNGVRVQFTKELATALRVIYRSGLGSDIDADLRDHQWSSTERAELASGIRDVLRYEQMSEDFRARVQALHDWLAGGELRERLEVVLQTPLWELHTSDDTIHDVPSQLVDLAEQLAARPDGLALALQAGRDLNDQDTRYRLLGLLAERVGAERAGAAALQVADWTAVAAALSVADRVGESGWVDAVLDRLARDEPSRVPELLTFVDLNPRRVEMGLSVLESGNASGGTLARLAFGARIKVLDEELAVRLLRAVWTAGQMEPALAMLDQWLDAHDQRTNQMRMLAGEFALAAVKSGGGTMIDYHVKRLVEAGILESNTLAQVWEARTVHRKGLPDELDSVLTERALTADPEGFAARIFGLLRGQAGGNVSFGLYSASDLALLDQLANATSVDRVWTELHTWPEMELRWALHHMDWSDDEPKPLVRRFLTSDRLAEIANEASVCFYNVLGVVTGPYSRALERELERARSWQRYLVDTTASSWADELVRGYEEDLRRHREREEEENLRFGSA
jgi:hypothetical protein